MDFITTEALVLRKTDYSESSLIIATLTPNHGRRDFVCKGARKSQRKTFPVIDLFRHLRIVYKDSTTGNLHAVREIDCIKDYNAIAVTRRNFKIGIWLNQFLLKNIYDSNPAPALFQAVDATYQRLSAPRPIPSAPIILGICFVLLSENGQLPDFPSDADCSAQVARMIKFTLNADEIIPEYNDSIWDDLLDWMESFINGYTDIKLVNGWRDLD